MTDNHQIIAQTLALDTNVPKHCDDYITDPATPECLCAFLDHARSPAHGFDRKCKTPLCYADYKGKRYKLTMASRFGDVGISTELHAEYGYTHRVPIEALSNFTTKRHSAPTYTF